MNTKSELVIFLSAYIQNTFGTEQAVINKRIDRSVKDLTAFWNEKYSEEEVDSSIETLVEEAVVEAAVAEAVVAEAVTEAAATETVVAEAAVIETAATEDNETKPGSGE